MNDFKAWLTRTIRSALLESGLHVKRRSSDQELEEFLSLIRPKATGADLIRIGAEYDGGYLVPDDLEGIAACFSPGVADTSDFELAMASRGIPCFMADYSVDAPVVMNPLFDFEKKYLGSYNDDVFMTLGDWVRRKNVDGDLVLQMDIEGAEYDVIVESTQETLQRFRIIIIEFHHLESLFDKFGLKMLTACFRKLTESFDIVHIHPNNVFPPVKSGAYEILPMVEVTFLRKDRATKSDRKVTIPHPLDRPNDKSRRDFPLPGSWFAHS